MRRTRFQLPVDTSMFTPLQLHPRTACWLAMSAWAHWLREHWAPFPRLIRDHGLGVVVVRLELDYLQPFTFFDADAVSVSAVLRARPDGRLLGFGVEISPGEGQPLVARVEATLRPLAIGEAGALSATPANLDAGVMSGFSDDELMGPSDPAGRPRARAGQLAAAGVPLATGSHTLSLHRHLCEAADQWSFVAMADVALEARERLVAEARADIPAVTGGLLRPMQRLDMEFHRPGFFLDQLEAQCRAYAVDDELVFLHRLTRPGADESLATFLESFARDAPGLQAPASAMEGARA